MPTKTASKVDETADRAPPRILYLLKQVQYKAYVLLERALQPLGVTAVQYRILATLEHQHKISSAQLSRLYDVKPQTMFKQIVILEAKDLIRRSTGETNKRVLEVELSPEGERVLRECDARATALEEELLEPFTPGEQAMYRELMLRMLKSMSRSAARSGEA